MTYELPKVWQEPESSGGQFANINRPTAGATHEQELPRGDHPLQLYSLGTPNGQKVTIMLEELLEKGIDAAEYNAFLIRIGQGDQFSSGFVGLNPNSKIPALIDTSVQPEQRVFESGNILLYLAEKFNQFLPTDLAGRTECLNWLFWQMGAGPILGGGFGHFFAYAPKKYEYPINRYAMEAKRQLSLLDQLLATRPYIAGDDYTIADMAIWPWYGGLVLNSVYEAAEFLDTASYKHLTAWAEKIAQRPAVQRGRRVNRVFGPEEEQMPERHSKEDFDN